MRLDVIYNEDCLLGMQRIPSGSVDMILCDLPYGTTECKWDSLIPFEPLWEQYKRIAKPNAAIVLTASQPFTSNMILSNLIDFRYSLVWDKVNRYTGYANANKMPLRRHEDISVFYEKLPTFNKQMSIGTPYKAKRSKGAGQHMGKTGLPEDRITINDGFRNPHSVLSFKGDIKSEMGIHPTQKPVALFEYLIRTYTNPGQIVLDNCMGSGTTAIACMNSGRSFIGFEKDPEYCAKAEHRILNHIAANSVTATVADENAA